ncbi:MAG: phospho-sugar mutase [Anaerorhabdus sp.]
MEKVELWYHHPNLDPSLKQELLSMTDKQKEDAFYTNITFGTAGMRGILGVGVNRMNIHTLRKANMGFAQYIVSNGSEACTQGIVIGYDNRHQSYTFALDCARLLVSQGIKAYIFESLRPTPELSFAVRHLKCFGGIMITASHNPKEYNGYKLYDAEGCQLVPRLADKVIENVNKIQDELAIEVNLTEEQEKQILWIGKEIDELYYEEVLRVQLNPQVRKNIKVVFSAQHGTSAVPIRELFKRAGIDVSFVENQCTPDPDFSNTITPNPEDPAAYIAAIALAKEVQADLILVCDPDADRMGVAVLNGDEYQLLTGNQSGALVLEYILSQKRKQGILPKNGVVFNTVVTGDLGEKIAQSYQVDVEKTLTGFKFIGEKIAQYEMTKEKEYLFGYEESYGSLIAPFARDKDAQQACLLLAEMACVAKEEGKTLSDVLNELYQQHGFYDESQFSILLEGEDGAKKIQRILESLMINPPKEIGNEEVVGWENYTILKQMKQGVISNLVGFVSSDVMKYYLADGSWVAVRPSGTEPKCKFYFCVCGQSQNAVQVKTNELHQAMREKLETIK